MIRNFLALIGALTLIALIIIMFKFGPMIAGVSKLDKGALPAFIDMFEKILKDGDPAKAMMKEYEVKLPKDELSNDDIADIIKSLTEEMNLRVTGDIVMFRPKKDENGVLIDFEGERVYDENGKPLHPEKIIYARIFSLCNLKTAKIFLAYSRYYGGFMPCRIMLLEYASGKRVLITMDLTLAIHGGYPLPENMLNAALEVKKAMETIPAKAAEGEF